MMYQVLDLEILRAVEELRHPLYDRECCKEAKRIAEATGRHDFRVIDGRIQLLRKDGKIRADRKTRGWRLA